MGKNIELVSSIENNKDIQHVNKSFIIVDNLYNKKFKVSREPKKSCKKCYGRGFIGYNADKNIILCPKCYR